MFKMSRVGLLIFLCVFFSITLNSNAGDYILYFRISGTDDTPDSIKVINQTKNTELMIDGDDILYLADRFSIIESNSFKEKTICIFPNPFKKNTTLKIYNPYMGKVHIQICDIAGRRIISRSDILVSGEYIYHLSGIEKGTYIINIVTDNSISSSIIISGSHYESTPKIELIGSEELSMAEFDILKSAIYEDIVQMAYSDGDNLSFIAYINNETATLQLTPDNSQRVNIGFPPVAYFNTDITHVKLGSIVNFTDGSVNFPKNWVWNFGDGSTSNEKNPNHIFNEVGEYSITLTVSNDFGEDSETKIDHINVGETPEIDFTVDKMVVTVDSVVIFTDNSENNPISWLWDFGDGNTENEQNPTHIYRSAGNYSVSLTASNLFGEEKKSISDYILVGNIPTIDFNISSEIAPVDSSVSFTDNTKGMPTSWLWDFGDGNTSTEQNPSHAYASEGEYTISLTASNIFGENTMVITDLISIGRAPSADFTFNKTETAEGTTFEFTDGSLYAPTIWNWDFGDGNTSTEQNPSHVYTSDGNYTITLQVSNAFGESTMVKTEQVTVGKVPEAKFTVDTTKTTLGNLINFTDSSSYNPTSWNWDFGDGNTSTLQNPIHIYSDTGIYTVKLMVSNDFGIDSMISEGLIKVIEGDTNILMDIDGNVYKIIQIGTQVWMAENLKTTKFNDGNNIPKVTNNNSWGYLSSPAYCWYNNQIANKDIYGALYNWYTISTNKVCPSGWHVPSDAEWVTLYNFVSADGHSGTVATALKGTENWSNDGNGTDDYGYSAYPGGTRDYGYGIFSRFGSVGYWWTSTAGSNAVYRYIQDVNGGAISYNYADKRQGHSIRCVKDQ